MASSPPRRTRRAPGQTVTLNGVGLELQRRLDRQVRMGPQRHRHIRNEHRLDARPSRPPSPAPAPTRSACASPTATAAAATRPQQISVGNFPPVGARGGLAEPGADRPDGDARTRANRPTRARSPTTSGTSNGNGKYDDRHRHHADDHDLLPRPSASHTVGVQLTDSEGLTTTTTSSGAGARTGRHRLRGSGPEHARPDRLLQARRASGPTIFDSKGSSNGTISGGTFGLPGAVAGRPHDRDRLQRHERLRRDPAEPVEHQPADDRVLAEVERVRQQRRAGDGVHPELQRQRGRLPRRPQRARSSAAPSASASAQRINRNSVFFARPSAGVWHHYALVINTSAAAGQRDHPLRRRPAGQLPARKATAAAQGAFANSTLYLMSRDGSALFGAGTLRPARDLQPAAERQRRSSSTSTPTAPPSRRPPPSRSPPSPVRARAERDAERVAARPIPTRKSSTTSGTLNGNGNYETDTGSNPTLKTSFATTGTYERRRCA